MNNLNFRLNILDCFYDKEYIYVLVKTDLINKYKYDIIRIRKDINMKDYEYIDSALVSKYDKSLIIETENQMMLMMMLLNIEKE